MNVQHLPYKKVLWQNMLSNSRPTYLIEWSGQLCPSNFVSVPCKKFSYIYNFVVFYSNKLDLGTISIV